ncbi:MAG: ATP-binding protein [Bacillota bacterium]
MSDVVYQESFSVERGNYALAGEASSKIKKILIRMGVDPALIRDIAIAAYEAELNLVIHSNGGELALMITPRSIRLICRDQGPGIPDISLAMKEGYSTAPESVRQMGFGAGMGLPNIKRHSQEFAIESEVGKGTLITASYQI